MRWMSCLSSRRSSESFSWSWTFSSAVMKSMNETSVDACASLEMNSRLRSGPGVDAQTGG
jgi:hypothetical protein